MGKQTPSTLFSLSDYRPYVQTWVQVRGRGEFRRIADQLKIHTTLVSQIFNGKKSLTEEQASNLCAYMGLNALETDYFLKLVQFERAGNEALRAIYRRHLQAIRNQSQEIKSRVPESKQLTEQDRAVYYSSWQYSFVRLLTSIEDFRTPERIAGRLNLSLSRVQEILSFLVSRGLCLQKDGIYRRTDQNTHVGADDALVKRHHQNWRVKALELQERLRIDDLVFTAPVSLSEEDFEKIREILLNTISEIAKTVEKSPSKNIAYLGIDWIRI